MTRPGRYIIVLSTLNVPTQTVSPKFLVDTSCLRTGLLLMVRNRQQVSTHVNACPDVGESTNLLLLPQSQQTDTRDLDDLESDLSSKTHRTILASYRTLDRESQASKLTPGISPLAFPRRPNPEIKTSSFSSTKFKQPSLGTKAVTFFPFLMSWTRTHFRMAELGCLASTPTCQERRI